jgi:phenylacetate-CoA ligase
MRPFPEDLLTRKQITTIQHKAWGRTFRHAFAHSPFYREHLRCAGASPKRPIPFEQIGEIPTIGKEVLSENPEAFLCVPREKVVDIVTTSGSTGQPMVYMLTESDLQRLALNEYHSFRCAGLIASDTVVLAVTLDRCFIAGMAYFMGLRMLGCSIVRVGPTTPVMHLELLQRTRATAIVGVPSFLCLLADKAVEAGLTLAGLGVRKLICIGEPIRQPDWSLNRAGELLERRWNARVFSTYGNTELAASLCECEAGRGGHLHPALLHMEALDDSGQPMPDGQVGELTATTFGVEAMPLIRYRTGDCAAIFRDPCPCGRRTLRIGPVVGRKGQKLKLKGTTIFPSTLKAVLDAAPEVKSYVIIARRGDDDSDLVEVRLACAGTVKTILGKLREQFQGAAKVAPELTLAAPAEIELLQLPEGTRKRRFFVDLRENGKAGA